MCFLCQQLFRAFPALLTPVILLGGIYSGVVTPTEAGAVAGLWARIISAFVYRVMGWKKLLQILIDSVKATGIVSIIVGLRFFSPISFPSKRFPRFLPDCLWMS
jgi:TRAP-type C4-dicarboxylate transport system permease large subunit